MKKKSDIKKKGKVNNKLWFWGIILIIIIIAIFSVGYFYLYFQDKDDCSRLNCPNAYYNITLKKCDCKTSITPPTEEPIENITEINNTINKPIPTPSTNISFGKKLKFTTTPALPQYIKNKDITIKYTLENLDNKTIAIPVDINNGIEVKNEGNIILDYTGTGTGVKILASTITIEPGKRTTGSFIIKSDEYNFYSIGNSGDGFYNTITSHIGDVNSNRIILRFI